MSIPHSLPGARSPSGPLRHAETNDARRFGVLSLARGTKMKSRNWNAGVLVIPIAFRKMQDQKVNNETVNAEQSLTLVRNLIRVTISQIAYIRNIFPSQCFEECQ